MGGPNGRLLTVIEGRPLDVLVGRLDEAVEGLEARLDFVSIRRLLNFCKRDVKQKKPKGVDWAPRSNERQLQAGGAGGRRRRRATARSAFPKTTRVCSKGRKKKKRAPFGHAGRIASKTFRLVEIHGKKRAA